MHFTSAENTTSKNFSGNRRFWLNVQNSFFSIQFCYIFIKKTPLLFVVIYILFLIFKFCKNNNIHNLSIFI